MATSTRTLYHQTDRESLLAIQRCGFRMQCGSPDSLAGAGIYFADSPELTGHKARRRGVILRAEVHMTRAYTISPDGDRWAKAGMEAAGADCVRIPRDRGTEWVVFDSDQVRRVQCCRRSGVVGCSHRACSRTGLGPLATAHPRAER